MLTEWGFAVGRVSQSEDNGGHYRMPSGGQRIQPAL